MIKPLRMLAAAWALLLAGPAFAALPTGTLEYTQRLGTVGATDTIEVWMRFTLGAQSPGLHFGSNPLSGFDPADLPATGPRFNPATNAFDNVPFAAGSITGARLVSWYACDTTFFIGCNGGGEYSFAFAGDEPGHPNPSGRNAFDLDPGQSIEYLLGRLTPRAGGAAPGTYRFFTAGLQLEFDGLDANGAALIGYHGLDATCPNSSPDCAFTRTVLAVPEPAGVALTATALLALALSRRRRGAGWPQRRS